MGLSIWPDPNSGGGPCGYCGKDVPGKHVWETDTGRRTPTGGIIFEPVHYHVKCRDRYQREHWHASYDAMTLDEARAWLHASFACACMGAPDGAPSADCHCRLTTMQAKRLQRGAHITVKLFSDARDTMS